MLSPSRVAGLVELRRLHTKYEGENSPLIVELIDELLRYKAALEAITWRAAEVHAVNPPCGECSYCIARKALNQSRG